MPETLIKSFKVPKEMDLIISWIIIFIIGFLIGHYIK